MPTSFRSVIFQVVLAADLAILNVHAVALGGIGPPPTDLGRIEPSAPDTPPSSAGTSETVTPVSENEIRTLVAKLDSGRFDTRNGATRRLLANGKTVVPYLVDALGDESGELRFRAGVLLTHHSCFEDVVPYLVSAVDKPFGLKARAILRQRTAQQIADACQPPHAEKLFKFWGTSAEAFRDRVLVELDDANTRAGTARVIEPLLGLCDETARFSEVISRLESLSLAYDHQYHPGFVIAQICARGLRERHSAWAVFAQRYLEAFETLSRELQLRDMSTHAIRKEVSDRASTSQGAAAYLVSILDDSSPQRALLSTRIGIPPERLQDSFCHGLASADPKEYYRGVGRVHIVEMLSEAIDQWPDAPSDGVVQNLIVGVSKTVDDGNKPKALAYLDALDACKSLSKHKMDVQSGLGRRLGERLCRGAEEAPDNRAYYPTRIVHETIVEFVDMGVLPSHVVFPREVLTGYLDGDVWATSEGQRLALQRYLRILKGLKAAGIDHQSRTGTTRFALAMRDHLTTKHELLAAGAREMDRLLQAYQGQDGIPDVEALDRKLNAWCRSQQIPARSPDDEN